MLERKTEPERKGNREKEIKKKKNQNATKKCIIRLLFNVYPWNVR